MNNETTLEERLSAVEQLVNALNRNVAEDGRKLDDAVAMMRLGLPPDPSALVRIAEALESISQSMALGRKNGR
jgi:hypothetical protein